MESGVALTSYAHSILPPNLQFLQIRLIDVLHVSFLFGEGGVSFVDLPLDAS